MDASIVIPTHNRRTQLQALLESLSQQTCVPECFEAIVVDDGSTDDTSVVADSDFPFSLKYVYQQNSGEVAARNCGIQSATGDILIFLDDDIRVEPQYVEALLAEHRSYPHSIVIGRLSTPLGQDASVFLRAFAETEGRDLAVGDVSFTECFSGVLSVSRSDFIEIGMMLPLTPNGRNPWGGIDFGYRAYRLGYRFRRCAAAVAYHDDYTATDLAASSRHWGRVAEAGPLLFERYPQLIEHVPMFADKRPINWRRDEPTLIARKALRGVVSTRPCLSAMEWVAHLWQEQAPNPRLLRPLYLWILGAHMYNGYRAGLRHRASH